MPDKSGFEADLFGVLDDLSAYLGDLLTGQHKPPYAFSEIKKAA